MFHHRSKSSLNLSDQVKTSTVLFAGTSSHRTNQAIEHNRQIISFPISPFISRNSPSKPSILEKYIIMIMSARLKKPLALRVNSRPLRRAKTLPSIPLPRRHYTRRIELFIPFLRKEVCDNGQNNLTNGKSIKSYLINFVKRWRYWDSNPSGRNDKSLRVTLLSPPVNNILKLLQGARFGLASDRSQKGRFFQLSYPCGIFILPIQVYTQLITSGFHSIKNYLLLPIETYMDIIFLTLLCLLGCIWVALKIYLLGQDHPDI
jgi:hypothetical protein